MIATTRKVKNGGVYFSPILDNMLRTYHDVPQVQITINNISSKCKYSCDFEWLERSTPLVQNIDISKSNFFFIKGIGFDPDANNNYVNIGHVPCSIIYGTDTQLICIPGLNKIL